MVNSLQGLAFVRQKRPFVCHASRVFANSVSKDMTRDQLVEHCRVVIEKQRPSSTVNEVRINGAMAGRQGNNMIVHEHAMRMMLHTQQPLCQSDIGVLRDFAQTRNQCKNPRILSKTHNGPGKFVFP